MHERSPADARRPFSASSALGSLVVASARTALTTPLSLDVSEAMLIRASRPEGSPNPWRPKAESILTAALKCESASLRSGIARRSPWETNRRIAAITGSWPSGETFLNRRKELFNVLVCHQRTLRNQTGNNEPISIPRSSYVAWLLSHDSALSSAPCMS